MAVIPTQACNVCLIIWLKLIVAQIASRRVELSISAWEVSGAGVADRHDDVRREPKCVHGHEVGKEPSGGCDPPLQQIRMRDKFQRHEMIQFVAWVSGHYVDFLLLVGETYSRQDICADANHQDEVIRQRQRHAEDNQSQVREHLSDI